MATSILGTFPILNHKKSQTDEYGFDYVSYQYTIKTSDLAKYTIKKDDVFTGIESWNGKSFAKSQSLGSVYVVDNVETKNTPGGLTELTVNTVGSKNAAEENSPRISLLFGGPLIFGLLGTPQSYNIYGYGKAGAGQNIEIKFLAIGGAAGQQALYTTYIGSIMPATFRGISLPVAAIAPGRYSDLVPIDPGNGDYRKVGYDGTYYGFACRSILTEKRGNLLLATLTFSESGYAYSYSLNGQNVTQTKIYDFPRIG
jgi:hypothetical protein